MRLSLKESIASGKKVFRVFFSSSGIETVSIRILYYLIDVLNYKKGIKLFLIWGVNPMIVFFLSEIIPQALAMISVQNPKIPTQQINLLDYLYVFGVQPFFSNPMTSSLVFALIYVAFWSVLLFYFYKKKWYFKV